MQMQIRLLVIFLSVRAGGLPLASRSLILVVDWKSGNSPSTLQFFEFFDTGHYIKGPGHIYSQKQTHLSVKAVLVAMPAWKVSPVY